jgi:hypothetical protein
MSGEPSPLPLHAETLDALGQNIGKHPDSLTVREFETLGHTKQPLLKVIRQNCLECAGSHRAEVRRCAVKTCAFWPYRMGSNPFYGLSSEERM